MSLRALNYKRGYPLFFFVPFAKVNLMLKLKVLLCVLNLIFIFAESKGNKVLTIKIQDYGNN